MNGKKGREEGGRGLQSIRGRILLMGSVAIASSVILGYVGISSLDSSSRNNEVLKEINLINVYQSENQSLDTSYLYFLDDSYLGNIVSNLGEMQACLEAAKKSSGGSFQAEMEDMGLILEQCRENYEQIRAAGSERGYAGDTGAYAEYLDVSETLAGQFQAIADDRSWVDGRWMDADVGAEEVEVDGRSYLKFHYEDNMPEAGKRNLFIIRIGGTGVPYQGKLYLNNIHFYNSSGDGITVHLVAYPRRAAMPWRVMKREIWAVWPVLWWTAPLRRRMRAGKKQTFIFRWPSCRHRTIGGYPLTYIWKLPIWNNCSLVLPIPINTGSGMLWTGWIQPWNLMGSMWWKAGMCRRKKLP